MYEDLTLKQREVIQYMKQTLREKGYPPSVREIGRAVNLRSTSTVHNHLINLEKKGYMKRDSTKPRAIEIFDTPFRNETAVRNPLNIPLVGTVTAGEPILAVENIEEYFSLPHHFVNSDEEIFLLKVRGNSMITAGIMSDDFVMVQKQSNAVNGDIVVAMLDDEATVKRFFKEKDYYRLQPENPEMEPIIVQEVSIIGKVIGLLRRY
ncbi:transcriptional repressor LexA [Anoxynatronum sibiricum]|uniref:LexA repressor n=1 Tax=Anoxynatronum sibiricum TaxID=210623 RepID=A0ABU9VQ76_9CLOT